MNKASNEIYLYQISTNPIHQKGYLHSMDEQDIGFGFGGDISIITGMNYSLETTIADIQNSAIAYISGDIDATTLFELGLAVSLGKTVYYVTEQEENTVEVLLPYDVPQLQLVSYKSFIQIVEEQMENE